MASKVRDGLFIGDSTASKDLEFVRLNKIHAIVNVAGKEIPNVFEIPGDTVATGGAVGNHTHTAQYLTFNWVDDGNFVIFGEKDVELVTICGFIDAAYARGDSVLICCDTGNCRAAGTLNLLDRTDSH